MSMKPEIGCYADGSLGHQHTRNRCSEFLTECSANNPEVDATTYYRALQMQRELRAEMSDDASEEDDACDFLDRFMGREDAAWGWQDGDFGLWQCESEDE